MEVRKLLFLSVLCAAVFSNVSAENTTDKFNHTSSNGWGGAWQNIKNSDILSSDGSVGMIEHTSPGRSAIALIGPAVSDSDISLKIEFITAPPSIGYTDVGLMLRADEQDDTYYVARLRWSNSSRRLVIERRVQGVPSTIFNEKLNIDTDVRNLNMHFAVTGTVPRLSAKVWDRDLLEPSFYQANFLDTDTLAITTIGQAGIRSSNGSSTVTNASITIDNFISSSCEGGNNECSTLPEFNPANVVKAWASFNGSTSAVRGNSNASTVTRDAKGVYTVEFDTAMENSNYAFFVQAGSSGNYSGSNVGSQLLSISEDSFQFEVGVNGLNFDYEYIMVTVVGN